MASYRIVLQERLPAKVVFSYVANYSNASKWDPGVFSSRAVVPGRPHFGSEYELDIAMRGGTTRFVFSIVEFEAPSRVVFESISTTYYARNVITVRSIAENLSELTYDATLRFRGFAALFNVFLAPPFHRKGRHERVGLAAALDSL